MTNPIDVPAPSGEAAHGMRPTSAQIQTYSRCNGGCAMCPYPKTSSELPQGRMPWELIERVVSELASVDSIRKISPMLQNEPLLDRRLERVIELIKKTRPDVSVGINTNGSLLDAERLVSLARAGLDSLIFSLNALTEETFADVQSRLSWTTVMDNLNNLIDNRPASLRVSVKAMIIRQNIVEIAAPQMFTDLIDRLKGAGIPFGADAISNRAGSLDGYDEMLVLEQTQSSKIKLWCRDPFDALNVLYNGDMIVCCADWSRSSTFGNLAKENLTDIWRSTKARFWRQMVIDQAYADVEPCCRCSQASNIMANISQSSRD